MHCIPTKKLKKTKLANSSFLRKIKNAKTSEYYNAKRRNQLGKHLKKWNTVVQFHIIELLLIHFCFFYLHQ